MAEALNSVYKAELIDRRNWTELIDVMAATAEWVGWYNAVRLHSQIGYRTLKCPGFDGDIEPGALQMKFTGPHRS